MMPHGNVRSAMCRSPQTMHDRSMSRRSSAGARAKIGLVALVGILGTPISGSSQPRALAITHVNVVDVIDGRIVPDVTVTIADATIASVAPNAKPPANARVVDGQGKYLIPGLWDMHAHMEATGEPWLQLYVAN